MKKIIFLFCLFLFTTPFGVKANNELSCNGYSFEAVIDDTDLVITKRGENPYMKVYSHDGYKLHVTNAVCTDDSVIFYGFAYGKDDYNFYDTFFLVTDKMGNELYLEVEDYGGNEETIGVAFVDDVLFVITRVDDLGDRDNDIEPRFDYVLVQTYDINYNRLDTIDYHDEVIRYDTTEKLLLIYTSYTGPVDIGFDSTMKEYSDFDVFDIRSSYDESFELAFINTGILNGEVVVNGFDITYPGLYCFEYGNQIYEFEVQPKIDGVTDGVTYDHSVSPVISGGNIYLNDDLYLSDTEITEPGNYTLKIEGLNGYEKSVQFTIVPKVDGVINGHDYDEPFIITFDGEGYLNNALVTSPLQIKDDGDYVLRVNGVGGLSDTYEFTLVEPESSISVQDVIQKVDVFILIISIVIGVILIKKK